jgi:nitroimidazol reductase NimA-like FMN-containing flavoprotein (pyridoxamine 5'-phosphate oxidase superfamily)
MLTEPHTESGVHVLSRDECLSLLASMPVGRLVFTDRALPAIVPVNFVLSGGHIVLRTGATSSLAAAVRGSVVAFEVDCIDAAGVPAGA